jgi:hypothetical protein
MSRSARSFMSITRFQVTRRTSMPSALPWWTWLSIRRRQQVVRQRNGVEVAGEVQVDVLHRHHLRVAAAGRAALHAEHRAQRGLAQADDARSRCGDSASPRPTVVVVLPSPAGVGVIAVTRISLPSGRPSVLPGARRALERPDIPSRA